MRCDVNISLQCKKTGEQANRVEIKNVLGIRFIEKVIEHEILRQSKLIDDGEKIVKETRRYDAINDRTFSLRTKEEDIDYRFLGEPDVPPVVITDEMVARVAEQMSPVPYEQKLQMSKELGMTIDQVQIVFMHPGVMPIFQSLVDKHSAAIIFKYLYNFVYGNVFKKELHFEEVLNENFKEGILLSELIDLVEVDQKLSPQNAK